MLPEFQDAQSALLDLDKYLDPWTATVKIRKPHSKASVVNGAGPVQPGARQAGQASGSTAGVVSGEDDGKRKPPPPPVSPKPTRKAAAARGETTTRVQQASTIAVGEELASPPLSDAESTRVAVKDAGDSADGEKEQGKVSAEEPKKKEPRRRKLVRGGNAHKPKVLPEFADAMSALDDLESHLNPWQNTVRIKLGRTRPTDSNENCSSTDDVPQAGPIQTQGPQGAQGPQGPQVQPSPLAVGTGSAAHTDTSVTTAPARGVADVVSQLAHDKPRPALSGTASTTGSAELKTNIFNPATHTHVRTVSMDELGVKGVGSTPHREAAASARAKVEQRQHERIQEHDGEGEGEGESAVGKSTITVAPPPPTPPQAATTGTAKPEKKEPRRRKLVRGGNKKETPVLPEFKQAMAALDELNGFLDREESVSDVFNQSDSDVLPGE